MQKAFQSLIASLGGGSFWRPQAPRRTRNIIAAAQKQRAPHCAWVHAYPRPGTLQASIWNIFVLEIGSSSACESHPCYLGWVSTVMITSLLLGLGITMRQLAGVPRDAAQTCPNVASARHAWSRRIYVMVANDISVHSQAGNN